MEPVRAILKRNPRSTVEAFVPAYCMPEPPKHAQDVEVGIMPTSSGCVTAPRVGTALHLFPTASRPHYLLHTPILANLNYLDCVLQAPVITPAFRVLPGLVRRIDIQVSSVSGVNRNVVLYAFRANQTIVATAANHIGGEPAPFGADKAFPLRKQKLGVAKSTINSPGKAT